ncbi:MAG: glycosyltransferase family 4 protein [Gemmatimonadota bacterium]
MRVVHVVTAFPRHEDDVVTPWLVQLLRRCRQRGVEAEVLAPAYGGGGDHTVHGIPVHRFRYAPGAWETLTHDETTPDRVRSSPAHAALVPAYLAAGVLAAYRLGRRAAPDVVHVHWPMPHALFGAAMRAGAGGGSVMVASFYAVEVNWVLHRLRWLRPLLRWSARSADAVTAISTATARKVQDVAGVVPTVIPFAAAVEGNGESHGREIREPLDGEDPVELLFVGRLVERKGVEVLVSAVSILGAERDVRLTVVGEGEWEPRIREHVRSTGVEDRVRFTGYVPDDDLAELYAGCDVFVLPAVVDAKGDTEGLGVVLLEALAFARPVVASEVGGIPDIVREGRTGWLVPPGDPGALAERILWLIEHPERAREIARQGRRIVGREFGWEEVVDRLLALYREVAGRGGERERVR